jgi:4-hydroxymandelate oxidase
MHRVREILSCSFVDHDPLSNIQEMEGSAREKLPPEVFDYYAGGAGDLQTLHENQVLSSLSTCRLEDVAAAASGPSGFTSISTRIAGSRGPAPAGCAAGFRAIVVTSDAPCWGVREADIRNGFQLPPGIEPVNLLASDLQDSHRGAGMGQIMSWKLVPSLTWKDIETIAGKLKVPVIVKGICRPNDALQAVEHGARGIIVSNHGGRQLDSAPATIEALPAVVQALGGCVPVLVDGGIRRGTDVLKALASGANAVLVGRPVLWGLATGGESGVAEALEMLRKEFDLAMALSGCASLDDITPDLLGRERLL